MNISTGSSTAIPQYAFNYGDPNATPAENGNAEKWKTHGTGSHLLFADGHVRSYDLTYYPKYAEMKTATSWDTGTSQWYNFNANTTARPKGYLNSIAVSP